MNHLKILSGDSFQYDYCSTAELATWTVFIEFQCWQAILCKEGDLQHYVTSRENQVRYFWESLEIQGNCNIPSDSYRYPTLLLGFLNATVVQRPNFRNHHRLQMYISPCKVICRSEQICDPLLLKKFNWLSRYAKFSFLALAEQISHVWPHFNDISYLWLVQDLVQTVYLTIILMEIRLKKKME